MCTLVKGFFFFLSFELKKKKIFAKKEIVSELFAIFSKILQQSYWQKTLKTRWKMDL